MNYFKTAILLICLAALLILIGGLIGGQTGAIVAFAISLLINGLSYWFSDKIVLAMYGAKEMQRSEYPHIYQVVEALCRKAGIPTPKVYMTETRVPNAFATGRGPSHAALCLTRGVMELLDEEELKGVISHELAHIKNRDTLIMTVTASIASAIMMLANMARWAAIFGGDRDRRDSGNIIALIALTIVAPLAAMLVQLAISRSREYGADARGAAISGSPLGLANALEELGRYSGQPGLEASPQTAHLFIVSPLSGSMIASLFSTHPPIAERVKRLRSMR